MLCPIVAASALIVFGRRRSALVLTWIGFAAEEEQLRGWVSFLGNAAVYAGSGAIVFSTALLYRIGPNRPNKLQRRSARSHMATALWWAATTVFGWYVRNIANYNVLYGSIGAVVALLVWMYLLSVIALYSVVNTTPSASAWKNKVFRSEETLCHTKIMGFQLAVDYRPRGDQVTAIEQLLRGIKDDEKHQVLLGVTGSGKTFTMAKLIEHSGRPALVLAHNKLLAAQLYHEFKSFFPVQCG